MLAPKQPTHHFTQDSPSQRGFTLMELSIVLVVVGILVGAILSGQHLLHTMRLSKVLKEFQEMQSHLIVFSERYNALPGDMPNATDYWGSVTAGEGCLAPGVVAAGGTSGNSIGAGDGTETCNGNDDDKIGDWSLPDLHHEMFRAWQHLYNAGMVSRAYTGVSGSSNSKDAEANVNVPAGPFNSSGWTLMRLRDYSTPNTNATRQFFNRAYGNLFVFGAEVDGSQTMGPILTPAEARNIDAKADDATPAGGDITAVLANWGVGAECTDEGGDSTKLDAAYNIDSEEVACGLYFLLPQEVRGVHD